VPDKSKVFRVDPDGVSDLVEVKSFQTEPRKILLPKFSVLIYKFKIGAPVDRKSWRIFRKIEISRLMPFLAVLRLEIYEFPF
jgi:hypothetical protein